MNVYIPISVIVSLITLVAMFFAYGTFNPWFVLGALFAGFIAAAAQHTIVLACKNKSKWFWLYWFMMVGSFQILVFPMYSYPTLVSAKIFWAVAFFLFSTLLSSFWFLGKKVRERAESPVWFWFFIMIGMIPNLIISFFIGSIFGNIGLLG